MVFVSIDSLWQMECTYNAFMAEKQDREMVNMGVHSMARPYCHRMASQISTTVLPTDLCLTDNRTTRRAHWRKLHLTPLSATDLLQPQSSISMCCCCH